MTDPERRRRRPTVYAPLQNPPAESPTNRENSSCALCKRRKIRCNRETPCSNCVRSRNGTCVYENHVLPPSRRDIRLTPERVGGLGRESGTIRHSDQALPLLPTPSSTASSPTPDVAAMQRRIRELESQLAGVSIKHPPAKSPPVELAPSLTDPFSTQTEDTLTTSTRLGGTFHVHNESSECGAGREGIPRSVTHKTRVFGQSHWINGIVLVS